MNQEIDLTPSPSILPMLGQINFSAIQCISELIDNALDSFIIEDPKKKLFFKNDTGQLKMISEKRIDIKIPKFKKYTTELEPTDSLVIEDNGKGMNREQLQNSLKAGFSGNDPINKLGLFGMGFNISTARLGDKTEILTSLKEYDYLYKVTIDFKELKSKGNFLAPIEIIKKDLDEMDKHGTKIIISRLNPAIIKTLRRKGDALKEIGKTYGKILREKGIDLIYDSTKCKPFQHCSWNPTRAGKNGVPAVINIDRVIDSKRFCSTCWKWLENSQLVCSSCGEKDNLSLRERRVKGWIGVQRFFDEDHYGFDLIRNGRVIKHFDKDLFSWNDPISGKTRKEYPVDGFSNKGRFVGEIEIDFVQVTHQKDAFVKSDDWQDFVNVIRGPGPIQPKLAKDNDFPINESPLAKLFSAFRTAKKGKLNLVPARQDGRALIQDPIIEDYKQRFFNNEELYLKDTKWWDLIIKGESSTDNETTKQELNDQETGGNIFDEEEFDNKIQKSEESLKKNPFEEFEDDNDLSGSYSIDLYKDLKINVKAFVAKEGIHEEGFEVTLEGFSVIFKYWPNSKIFEETFMRPEELLINELAYSFFLNGGGSLAENPLSLAERSIKKKYFPDLHPEVRQIDEQIDNLARDIKSHMRGTIKKLSNSVFSQISSKSRSQIKRKMFESESFTQQEMDNAQNKNEFLAYADLKTLVEILNIYPQTLFDGEFFKYKVKPDNIHDKEQEVFLKSIESIFADIVWWINNDRVSSSLIWKGRSRRVVGSLEILRGLRR